METGNIQGLGMIGTANALGNMPIYHIGLSKTENGFTVGIQGKTWVYLTLEDALSKITEVFGAV